MPRARFEFDVPPSATAGSSLVGTLSVTAESAIARATRLVLVYVARLVPWEERPFAGPRREDLHRQEHAVDLAPHGLPAEGRAFPFAFAIPSDVPPSARVPGFVIRHWLEATLEIAWAPDASATLEIGIAAPTSSAENEPWKTVSRAHFAGDWCLWLDTRVIEEGGVVTGSVMLVRDDPWDVTVEAVQRSGPERDPAREVRGRVLLRGSDLATRAPIPFRLATTGCGPTFRGLGVVNDLEVGMSLLNGRGIPARADISTFVRVVPAGSTIRGAPVPAPSVGAPAMTFARALSERLGFAETAPPLLAEGALGPVWVRVYPPTPRGVFKLDFSFPDVELGIQWSHASVGDASRPRGLAEPGELRYEPHPGAPRLTLAAKDAFVRRATSGLDHASDVHLGDRHLTYSTSPSGDGGAILDALVGAARSTASALAAAIEELPSPPWMAADSIAAWSAAPGRLGGFLVRSGPSLSGVPLTARLVGGAEVVVFATIRTVESDEGPRTVVDVDLATAPVPEERSEGTDHAHLEGAPPERPGEACLAEARSAFPRIVARGATATLTADGFAASPADLKPALDAFLSWVLEVRGTPRERAKAYR
ncbi:MAG: hypothetical protein U0414_12015 [Polyangiaceae bacterium]